MFEKHEKDKGLWSVDDVAAISGISRQRLGDLLNRGVYPYVVVPFRDETGKIYQPEDVSGRVRRFRHRLIEDKVVQRIVEERSEARARQRELEAAAEKRRKNPPKPKKRGRKPGGKNQSKEVERDRSR